ncbi:MAG: type II toxin-antitoxin system HicA family toxin [Phycisphaerales bacterium]|nr:type II toxin-antitoxin system HicA family toxin [Phycisphaerales bacterium]
MSKRGAMTYRQVIRLLKKHGFVEDHHTGTHCIFYHPETRRRAVVPVHGRDLPRGTLHGILKSAGID